MKIEYHKTWSNNLGREIEYKTYGESGRGVESLIEIPAIMTHASVPKEVRKQNGISDTLICVSAGIEDTEDLVEDFRQALK